MDTELSPQLLFLPQCVALSPRKFARIEPLKPQDKFATPNMTKLLTPPSLNTAKRQSPPSVNRSAPRPDIAPVLLDQKLLLPTMVPLLLPLMLMLLVQLLLEELLPLDMVPDTVPVLLEVLSVMLAQLLLDTLVPELVLLDMPHGNQEKQYSLFRHLHY